MDSGLLYRRTHPVTDDISQRIAALETINRLSAKLRDVKDSPEAFGIIASELKTITGVEFAAIALVESSSSLLKFVGMTGFEPDPRRHFIQVDEDFRKRMSSGRRSVSVRFNNVQEVPPSARTFAEALGADRAVISSILLRGELVGYLMIANRSGGSEIPPEADQLMTMIADDISIIVENVKSALELRRAKEDMERMFTLAPIGIFRCDSKGIFEAVNRQLLTMFDKESESDLIGTSVFELPLVAKSGLDGLIMGAMEGHEGEKADVHVVPKQDKAYYLHVKVTPIKSAEGETKGVLFVAMDMTSKVRLQNQLERSYEKMTQTFQELERVTKMKTQFIDIVSHELRTPLTVMRGYIDLVESEYVPKLEPKFASRLKIIKANTDKLYSLVESMLDVSRLEKGSLQIHPEPVRIDAILEDIVGTRRNEAEAKKQTMTLEVEGKLPLVMADRRRLKDVFNNLVDNAMKYTQEGGRIQVCARDEGKMIHIWVKDNGVGIPLENLGKIFDRFHIVTSNDLSHQVDRLGLGLPISKGIIEAHQGRIWVESQVGKGSVFHVDIPKEPLK